jgi:hypothetical protein
MSEENAENTFEWFDNSLVETWSRDAISTSVLRRNPIFRAISYLGFQLGIKSLYMMGWGGKKKIKLNFYIRQH